MMLGPCVDPSGTVVPFYMAVMTSSGPLLLYRTHIRTVQELLGHKDIRMTMRYSHLAPDHMRKAVSALDDDSEQSDALEEAYS
jgi:hypothetical protein